MLELRDDPATNIVELTVDGSIDEAEFDEVIERIEAKIRAHGEVRVLEHVRSVGSFPPSRMWQDIKFAVRNRRNFSHAAVVGDQLWLGPMTRFARLFFDGDLRHFSGRQIEEARAWLRRDAPSVSPPSPSASPPPL